MNVSLTPEMEKLVNEKVENGMYASASEVIREGLRLLQQRDEMKYEALKRDIREGLDELDEGEGIPAAKVFAEMKKKAKAMRRS
jgi:antitoxin ParD1/3/4